MSEGVKKKRRTSAEVRSDIERKEMIDGFVSMMDDDLFVEYFSAGGEGYVSGTYACAERITDAILGGIKAAGKKS